MTRKRAPIGGILLNVSIGVIGLAAGFLLYALIMRGFQPRTDATREANPAQLVGDILQIEVRNGCGVSGLAGTTTQFLREHGFDVVEVGDYHRFDVDSSSVIDRVGDLESAQKVAAALGIRPDRVQQEVRTDLYLDATVILGMDYTSLRPFRDESNP